MTQALEIRTEQGLQHIGMDELRALLFPTNKPQPTDNEIALFIETCRARGMNPLLRDAYLIKYDDKSPAQIVTGKEYFTKMAQRRGGGFKAGIVVAREGQEELIRKEGTIFRKDVGETLVGGWAVVTTSDRGDFEQSPSMEEYASNRGLWGKMPATMIRKVALVAALREAYPDDLGGMYDAAEMQQGMPDNFDIVDAAYGKQSDGEILRTAKPEKIEEKVDSTPETRLAEALPEEIADLDLIKAADIPEAFGNLPNPMSLEEFGAQVKNLIPDMEKDEAMNWIAKHLGRSHSAWVKKYESKGYGYREAYILLVQKNSGTQGNLDLPW